jgi:hypothetical protein
MPLLCAEPHPPFRRWWGTGVNAGEEEDGLTRKYDSGDYKVVFVGKDHSEWLGSNHFDKQQGLKYNFETGVWVNRSGERYKGGKLVE